MKKRVITAIVGIILMVPVCIFSDTWVYPITVSLLSLAGAFEMLRCVGMLKPWSVSAPLLLISAAAPAVARLFPSTSRYMQYFGAVAFLMLVYLLALSVFYGGKLTTERLAVAFVTVLYVTGTFGCLVLLRDTTDGQYLYLLALIGPWVSDAFALFCGMAFGKHKLIPSISPKKTVEGSVGALILTPAATVLFGIIAGIASGGELKPNYLGLVLVGVVMSAAGQIGDLIASAIKRQYGIKDYGRLFPGHGGVMDRFDSILTTAPLLLLLSILPQTLHIFR